MVNSKKGSPAYARSISAPPTKSAEAYNPNEIKRRFQVWFKCGNFRLVENIDRILVTDRTLATIEAIAVVLMNTGKEEK
jgi:hypothetical protein